MFHIRYINIIISVVLLALTYQYKPIIGIFANPYPDQDYIHNNQTVIHGPYVRWLESFGAEVLAIHQWYTHEQIDDILSKVNGVLFMGGGRDFNFTALWEQQALYIMKASLAKGFPLWGTCLGFQLILQSLSEVEGLLKGVYNHMGHLDNLTLTSNARGSRMYSYFNEDDFYALENRNATIYFHQFGVNNVDWNTSKTLTTLFDVTSFAFDLDDRIFVNSYEGKNDSVNIFATQYHPEKNPYVRYDGFEVEHTVDVLRTSHKLGLRFIEQARQNTNRMKYNERKNYDFINTYAKGSEDSYDPEGNAYYFSKKDNK